jgi:fatty acid desaturase
MARSSLASIYDDAALVADVKSLSKLSDSRAASAIALEWLMIGATIGAAIYFDAWWSYLPAIVIVAARQHALGIIMHDATHYRLFSSRRVNDLVSDWFCAFPTGLSTLGYREDHLEHHLATNTDGDPYYVLMENNTALQWPKTKLAAVRHLLAETFGWHTLQNMKISHPWTAMGQYLLHRNEPRQAARVSFDLISTGVFWCFVAAGLAFVGGWWYFAVLWVLPGLTCYQLFVRLRWMSEHPYRPATGDGYDTHQVRGSPIERFCIAPLNINYHITHHLFPATPFYRLPGVHRRLLENAVYRDQANFFANYLGSADSIWADVVTKPGGDAAPEKSHEPSTTL